MLSYIVQDRPAGRPIVRLLTSLMRARTLSAALFRLSQVVGRRFGVLGDAVKQLNQLLTGADMAWQAQIGPRLKLYHPQGVVIGAGVRIGADCEVQQGVTFGTLMPKDPIQLSPTIGDRCLLGAGSKVIGAVVLGDDVIVGANAVCIKDAPNGSVVLGVPGKARPRKVDG